MDPAGNKFGLVGVIVGDDSKLSIDFSFLIEAPQDFKSDAKNIYISHAAASIVALYRPDIVVSEDPFGIGWSQAKLQQLVGQLKSEMINTIEWQRISEARRAVLGDGYGAAKKRESAEWLLQYNWDISSKRMINKWLDAASKDTDDGYDILDALLHAVCYLVANDKIKPVHKPEKIKKGGKIKTARKRAH